MKIPREELIAVLNQIKPALHKENLASIFQCFCFTGKVVFAYNTSIAIQAPFVSDFSGAALPGELLLKLLNASRAKEVELKAQTDSILIKASRTKMNLATDSSKFVYEVQSMKGGIDCGDDVIQRIDSCMRSVGSDRSIQDVVGITLKPTDNGLTLYSTNIATVSKAEIQETFGLKEAVILPQEFCKEMLRLRQPKSKLFIGDKYALFSNGKELLWGGLLVSQNPIDFDTIFEHHIPRGYKKKMVPIPTNKLDLMLDRAIALTDYVEHKSMILTVKDGVMYFNSKASPGVVDDHVEVGSIQEDVVTTVDPNLIKRGINFFDSWMVTEQAVLMEKGDMRYLVATSGKPEST